MAQKLKFGNGTWATKKGSTLAYNDENNNYKPLPFTTTRDSIATRVNKAGLIETVGNNEPRIDYTDSTEGALLLENSSTNLIPYSEDFSQWTGGGINITPNDTISPNGTLDADKVQSTDAFFGKYIQPTVSSGTDYTASVFVKNANDNNSITFRLLLGTNDCRYIFNIQNLTVTAVSGYTSGFVSSNIEDYGNGWVKCSLTVSSNGTSSVFSIYPKIIDTSETKSANLWGAQLESNSVASSYIPTNGSTVQRAAETCNGSGNSEVFNDSQGVLFANIADFGSGINVISLNTGNNTQKIMLYLLDGNKIRYYIQGSGGFFSADIAVTSTNNFSKILIKYKQNDFSLWVNGFEVDANTSSITFDNLSSIDFYNPYGGGVDNFYGKTKEIGYYDEILTDLELETLTSYRSLNEMVTELNLNAL